VNGEIMTYYVVNLKGFDSLDELVLKWREWASFNEIPVNINNFINSPTLNVGWTLFNTFASFQEGFFLEAAKFSGIIKYDYDVKIYYNGFECSLDKFLAQLDGPDLTNFLFNLDDI
jgi:hypothetical protein